LRAALAAALLAGLSAVPSHAAAAPALRMPSVRKPSKHYPEQSSRQALRGMRRAQGGPGLVLVRGKYAPAPQVL
jgi:hypothetical protein